MLVGIVGKPNCGKSTFFKAVTLADVLIANYPFATIVPNKGFGHVRMDCADTFFNTQCNPRFGFCMDHKRFVPIEVIDVAGLVPGAYEGKGMGNQFLDDLRQADVLIHVIDCSGGTNEKGEVIQTGTYDPANDIKFLEIELDMWYLGILKKGWEKFARQLQQEQQSIERPLAKQLSGLGVSEDLIKETLRRLQFDVLKPTLWTEEQLLLLSQELRKKTKPMVIAANKIDVGVAKENLDRLQKQFPEYIIIGCSAESELALKEAAKRELLSYIPGDKTVSIKGTLSDAQKKAIEFIQKKVLEKNDGTGVQKILNTAVFDMLKYIAIYPGGVNNLVDSQGRTLPDCFLLKPNSTALDFAFKLHTDFGKNFIRAIDVKTKRTVGKDHLLKQGDVVELMTSK